MSEIITRLGTIVLTVAALAQGLDAVLNIVERYKKNKDLSHSSNIGTNKKVFSFKVTPFFSYFGWYLFFIVQVPFIYSFLQYIRPSEAELLFALFLLFWLIFPYYWNNEPHSKIYFLVMSALISINFILGVFQTTAIVDNLTFFSVGFSISIVGLQYIAFLYWEREYFKPWWHNLQDK